jgi:hypothetical protein
MDLRELLENENPKLHRYIENVRDAAGRILEKPLHHHYTDHSLRHSERIIGILNSLTEELMNSEGCLSVTEIYILLAAAYLHDIGMQDRRFIDDEEYSSIPPDKSYYEVYVEALERIRAQHHEFTHEMILDYLYERDGCVDLGLPRIPIVDEQVALVAKAHRKVNLNSLEDAIGDRGESIRSRLLAALLRFADELDIDHNRVYMGRLRLISPTIRSRYHWYLSYYVHAVQIQDEMITICYRFPPGCRGYEEIVAPLVEQPIRSKREELKSIFWPNRIRPEINTSIRQFSKLISRLPADVETFAREELCKQQQKLIDDMTSKMHSLSPEPLASEMFDAR